MPMTPFIGVRNLVAHVRHELALHPVRLFGLALGDDELVVHFDESAVALLDVREHLIEAGDEAPDFVFAGGVGAQRIVLVDRDAMDDPGEMEKWTRDQRLQPRREDQRKQRRHEEDEDDDLGVPDQPRADLSQVRFEVDGADRLSLEQDLAGGHQSISAEDRPAGRELETGGRAGGAVGREEAAVFS